MHLEMNALEARILSPMKNKAKLLENSDSIQKHHLEDSAVAAIANSLNTEDQTRVLNEANLWHSFSPFFGVFDIGKPLQPHEEAAILIQYARDARTLNVETLTTRSRWCFQKRVKYQVIFRLAAWGLLVIRIFERPQWTYRASHTDWQDASVYPSFGVPFLPFSASIAFNLFFLAILWVAVVLEFGYKNNSASRNFTIAFSVILTFGTFATIFWFFDLVLGKNPSFGAGPFNSCLILLVEHYYENYMGYMLRLLPTYLSLLLLLGGSVCTYTALGFLIFDPNSSEYNQYFSTFGTALWNMFMVLNGSNWPTPMIPAFNDNTAYCLYFFIYIILFDWGLLNLITGFVYGFFQEEEERINNSIEVLRQSLMGQAFKVMDSNNYGVLSIQQMDVLLKEVFEFYESTNDLPTQQERLELIMLLDAKGECCISMDNFVKNLEAKCFKTALRSLRAKKNKFQRYLGVANVQSKLHEEQMSTSIHPLSSNLSAALIISREKKADESVESSRKSSIDTSQVVYEASIYGKIADNRLVQIYRQQSIDETRGGSVSDSVFSTTKPSPLQNLVSATRTSGYLVALNVDSFLFDLCVDSILLVLAVVFFCSDSSTIFVAYLLLSIAEFALKILFKGSFRYVRSKRNSIDGVLTVILTIISIYLAAEGINSTQQHAYSNNFIIRAIIILRVLLFPRNIIGLNQFRNFRHKQREILDIAFRGADHIYFLFLVFLVLIYWFASTGMLIYGGLISTTGGNFDALISTEYGIFGYWPLNFNDFPSALITMFVLLQVNNMHITVGGLVAVTNNWTKLYFSLWYAVGVLLLLNILTAFFLNHLAEYLRRLSNKKRVLNGTEKASIEPFQSGNSSPVLNSPVSPDAEKKGEVIAEPLITPNAKVVFETVDPVQSPTNSSPSSNLAPTSNAKRRTSLYTEFNSSIFASDDDRTKLVEWFSTHDPTLKSPSSEVTNKPQQEPSSSLSSMHQPNESENETHRVILQTPFKDRRLSLKNKSFRESEMKTPVPSSHAVVAASNVAEAKDSFQDDDSFVDEEIDEEIFVDMDNDFQALLEGALMNYYDENNSISLSFSNSKMKVKSLRGSITATSDNSGASLDGASFSTKERQRNGLMSVFRSQRESMHFHERNLQKNIESRQISTSIRFRTKKAVLDWMYGVNQISRIERAAVLIQFARDGEEHSVFSSERSLACYKLRSKYSALFKAAPFAFVLLRFFERPLWTFYHTEWNNSSVYPISGVPLLSPYVMIGFKLPLLILFATGLLLEVGYKEISLPAFFQTITKTRVVRYVLLLYCLACIFMLLFCCGNPNHLQLVTTTSAGGICYVLWFNRKSLKKLELILIVLPQMILVLLMLSLLVIAYAAFGPTFGRSSGFEDDYYFNSFSQSIWSIFVAITSSSWPGQILPTYNSFREVCLFFVSFICLGSYVVLNVIIIVVLVQFNMASQRLMDFQKVSRKILLMRAFEILDEDHSGFISKKKAKLLLEELYQNYSDFQKAGIPKAAAMNILVTILDVDNDGKISLDDFLLFLDVTRLKLSAESKLTFLEVFWPSIANSVWVKQLKALVDGFYFDLAVDLLGTSLIAAMLIIDQAHQKNIYQPTQTSLAFTSTVLAVYMVDVTLKLCLRGFSNYFRQLRSKVDFSITTFMLLSFLALLWYGYAQGYGYYRVTIFSTFVRIAQMSRIIIFPRHSVKFVRSGLAKKIARLIRRVVQRIYTLSIAFFCVSYFFATIGVFCYGGLIQLGSDNNPNYQALVDSRYGQNDFWGINFNDFTGAYITLFCCLHVSDFDVITSGFTAATSNASRLYFAAWYVMGVLLLLNIVKSFFLADFMGLVGRTAWKMPSPADQENSTEEQSADEADGEKPGTETRPSVSLAMRNRLIEKLTVPAAEEIAPNRKMTLESEKGSKGNEASRKNSSVVHDSHDSGSVHSPILLDTTYSLHMPASEDETDAANHMSHGREVNRSPLKGNVGMLPTSEDTNNNYLISTFNCKYGDERDLDILNNRIKTLSVSNQREESIPHRVAVAPAPTAKDAEEELSMNHF